MRWRIGERRGPCPRRDGGEGPSKSTFGRIRIVRVVRIVRAGHSPLAIVGVEREIRIQLAKRLRRRYARVLPYAAEERGYGPDEADTLVIWQGGTQAPPAAAANARIVPVPVGLRAVIEPA